MISFPLPSPSPQKKKKITKRYSQCLNISPWNLEHRTPLQASEVTGTWKISKEMSDVPCLLSAKTPSGRLRHCSLRLSEAVWESFLNPNSKKWNCFCEQCMRHTQLVLLPPLASGPTQGERARLAPGLGWHHFQFTLWAAAWLKCYKQQSTGGTYANGGRKDHLILIFVIFYMFFAFSKSSNRSVSPNHQFYKYKFPRH